jgi:FKBP-type peptidyl-prolyl cis-trans isomerase
VLVHYRGATINGAIFDTTYDNGTPVEIPLDQVIPGWSEGLRMMKEGGKARLFIPPDLAYGERGAPPTIAPQAVIIFDVELLSIIRPSEEESEEDWGDEEWAGDGEDA